MKATWLLDEQQRPLIVTPAGTPSKAWRARPRAAGVRWKRCCRFLASSLLACLLVVLLVILCFAERRSLRLQQLFMPLQWAMISADGRHHSRGYEVVDIPEAAYSVLKRSLNAGPPAGHKQFGGPGERSEDIIIFGPTSLVYLDAQAEAAVIAAFRPLLTEFCATELEHEAIIGGGAIRVYRRGAWLAHHLDWAHRWVCSATLNLRQSDNRTRWPLTMRPFGRSASVITHHEGQAVLYEGSRLVHARPPLDDDWYAAVFVGFRPRDYPRGSGLLTQLVVNTVSRLS